MAFVRELSWNRFEPLGTRVFARVLTGSAVADNVAFGGTLAKTLEDAAFLHKHQQQPRHISHSLACCKDQAEAFPLSNI